LIATDFAPIVKGEKRAIQQQSTYLSTDFCGYRLKHYIESVCKPCRYGFDALRKLAAPRPIALKSPGKDSKNHKEERCSQ
jgi:hypothetical protein